MSDLTKRSHEAKGLSGIPDPLIEQNRVREAETRTEDYSALSRETRPLVPASISLDALVRLFREHQKRSSGPSV